MITPEELKAKGGKWLGAMRNWVKWNCTNGSTIKWGSCPTPLTIKSIEDLSATVAAAAINEHIDKGKSDCRDVIKEFQKGGWTFQYESGTRYIGVYHPHGGKQSICEMVHHSNRDEFGEAIALFLNTPINKL